MSESERGHGPRHLARAGNLSVKEESGGVGCLEGGNGPGHLADGLGHAPGGALTTVCENQHNLLSNSSLLNNSLVFQDVSFVVFTFALRNRLFRVKQKSPLSPYYQWTI